MIFASFEIGSNDSYRPEKKKVEALAAIQPSRMVKELRSFMGLVNCFRQFMQDLSQKLTEMRGLLKQDVAWVWTPKMQQEFKAVKKILTGPLGLSAFESGWDIFLYVDYSGVGMGLCLTQCCPRDNAKKKVIFCDSMSLSKAQRGYSALYGEHTALAWSILRCKFWLRGAEFFTIYSNQIALSHIYSKKREIQDFPEELQSLAIKLMNY